MAKVFPFDSFGNLADPLGLWTKAGPKRRQESFYKQLRTILAERKSFSELSPYDEEDQLRLRDTLNRTLEEHAYFGYVRFNSKLPHVYSEKAERKGYLETPSGFTDFERPHGAKWLAAKSAPLHGNWSVIPKEDSRLLVFDFDVTKEKLDEITGELVPTNYTERFNEANKNIGLMEGLLGIDFKKTYGQISPSGGVHFFTLLPEGVTPRGLVGAKFSKGMKSLLGIPVEDWDKSFKGDIRSGASTGSLVMAGSSLPLEQTPRTNAVVHYMPLPYDRNWKGFKDFTTGRKLRLLELPASAVAKLQEAYDLDLKLRGARPLLHEDNYSESIVTRASTVEQTVGSTSAKESVASTATTVAASELTLRNQLFPLVTADYSELIQRARARGFEKFHQGRAYIFKALSCCKDNEFIANICHEAGYDRDTYLQRELTEDELFYDLDAMRKRGLTSTECGAHCHGNGASGELSEHEQQVRSLVLALLEQQDTEVLAALSSRERSKLQSALELQARTLLRRVKARSNAYSLYRKRTPRGLAYQDALRVLLGPQLYGELLRGEDLKVPGYRRRAIELLYGYFAPLFASGASQALASMKELQRLFSWSPSHVKDALRHLRAMGVLEIAHRQTTGSASTYSLAAEYVDPLLSAKLLQAWSESKFEEIEGQRAFLGGFFDVLSGTIYRPNGSGFTDTKLATLSVQLQDIFGMMRLNFKEVFALAQPLITRYLARPLNRYFTITGVAKDARRYTLEELQTQSLTRRRELGHQLASTLEKLGFSEVLVESQESKVEMLELEAESQRKLAGRAPPTRAPALEVRALLL